MILNWLLTGDTHGRVSARLKEIQQNMQLYEPTETAIIILGDAGFNFYLNKTDAKEKERASAFGYTIYCVRGNHEERPKNIPTYSLEFDENVGNFIYVEKEYPNIKFFKDGETYLIGDYRVLVLGGAYSVDKWYRLGDTPVEENNPKKTGWFSNEQLSADEMHNIEMAVCNNRFDFVFSHTCPYSWMPRDLFLSFVDQDSVDNSMEIWMDHISNIISWGIWCFGHFHADRIERPYVEQYYQVCDNIEDIWERWKKYGHNGELDWWLRKSPHMAEIMREKERLENEL